MTVLDAYAVIAYLREEPAAEEVTELLRQPTVLSTVNAAEVLDQLVRVLGLDTDDVHAALLQLEQRSMRLTPVTNEVGLLAGALRAKHYHRERAAVSMCDCIAAAMTLTLDRPIATSDPALATLVRAEGGTVLPLPDSSGRRP